jgi:hypothetical protein
MPPLQHKPEDQMTSETFFKILNEIQACTSAIEEATRLSLQDSGLIDRYRTHRTNLYNMLLLRPSAETITFQDRQRSKTDELTGNRHAPAPPRAADQTQLVALARQR